MRCGRCEDSSATLVPLNDEEEVWTLNKDARCESHLGLTKPRGYHHAFVENLSRRIHERHHPPPHLKLSALDAFRVMMDQHLLR